MGVTRIVFIVCITCSMHNVLLLENGLALTPPMGWMSWTYYKCGEKCNLDPDMCLNEKLIMSVADSFFNDGYQEAGFEYIIIDDCWSEFKRDSRNRLVPHRERFPRGMKYLADYIHSRGLKFGMYINIANVTCMGYPGSKDYFSIDIKTFAEWEVDYVKVDGCFNSEEYLNTAYIDLGKVINETGRPMVYSCSWPYYIQYIHRKQPDLAAAVKYCNLWRNYHDIQLSWDAVHVVLMNFKNEYHNIEPYHGPGHWNDPDMLILGTETLTEGQSRIQLTVFAMLSAPLLLSCDMKKITKQERQMLTNMDLIAIAQDPLGKMAKPFSMKNTMTMWVKQHLPMKGDTYHSYSFALVNWNSQKQTCAFKPKLYGDLKSADGYTVMDVFSKDYVKNVTSKDEYIIVTVPPQDVVLYTLYAL